MTPIKPTLGRIVLVCLLVGTSIMVAPAIVNAVHSDTAIGVTAFPYGESPVDLRTVVYDDGKEPRDKTWYWMPYQLEQAAKATLPAQGNKPGATPAKHPFDYHRPNETQVDQITTVREGCKALHATLLNLPNCRERSLAITKLEEVSMWANKGIIMVDEGPVATGA